MRAARTLTLIAIMVLASTTARAALLLDVNGALSLSDPLQTGRLSRNGVPQDWTGSEPFPGVINITTAYRYHTYQVNAGQTPFIQVLFDSVSVDTFISAYDTSYNPNSAAGPNFGFDLHWLGDAGTSSNFFGIDPLFFQVVTQPNKLLVLVVAESNGANAGVGDPFRLTVEGFVDTEYHDVPEPASLLLGLVGIGIAARRRRR